MELFLIRHADAKEHWDDEAGPELSERGKVQAVDLVERLREVPSVPEIVLSSPLRRAVQTAGILNQAWNAPEQIVPWLIPGTEASRILHELSAYPQDKIAIVSHLPSLGWLLSVLLWGMPPRDLAVEKASCAWLRLTRWEPGAGRVLGRY